MAALFFVVVGLGIGYFKSKMIFAKTVRKSVERILSFAPPIHLSKMYSVRYCLLLAAMVLLGISFKYFGFPHDVRGLVDVAIGSALINGAMIYMRSALSVRDKEKAQLESQG